MRHLSSTHTPSFRLLTLLSHRTRVGLLGVATLALVIGCSDTEYPVEEPPGPDSTTPGVYLAFSGGGWRAHTAHAGWTIGLLGNRVGGPQTTLEEVFEDVSIVSSNSGGSWFNVMLSYSDDFRTLVETTGASSSYTRNPSNYFLLEKTLLQDFPEPTKCDLWEPWPQLYFACVVGEGIHAPLDWKAVIEGVVFEPYSMATQLDGVTLGSGIREPWAKDKALLLAATALTQGTVLSGSTLGDKYFYDAPALAPLNMAPVTFSSLPNPPAQTIFPSAPATFDVTYSSNAFFPDPVVVPGNPGDVTGGSIEVVTAASASSAATGFVASHAIVENNSSFFEFVPLTNWQIAYEASELALYFNLPDPSHSTRELTRSPTPPSQDSQANASGRYVRLADGGALDNSAVIQAVARHQQQHGTAVPFDIIAFDSVQEAITPMQNGQSYAPVGIDIAYLFGEGFTDLGNGQEGFCTGATSTSQGFCLTVVDHSATPPVSPQVFETDGIYVDSTWTYPIDSKHRLIYTRYDVTTVDSALMGVVKGTTGTVHAFTTQWADANTAPWTTSDGGPLGDEDWAAYAAMFDAIQEGLQQHGGLAHLRAALGLSP